jgi:hypothetical protein
LESPKSFTRGCSTFFNEAQRDIRAQVSACALAKREVERMDGKIGVETAPDRGSRFWVELKRAGEIENG